MRRLICAVVVLGLAGAGPAWSAGVDIETEDYTDHHDIAFEPIHPVDAPSCSGGWMLVGLDYPDEWTAYTVSPGAFGYFSVVMKARGDPGVDYRLRLELTGETSGLSQSIDITFRGLGYG